MQISKKYLGGAIVVLLLFLLGIPQNLFKRNVLNSFSDDSAKKTALEDTYNKLMDFDKNSNYEGFYEYLTPSDKSKISKEEYLKKSVGTKKPLSVSFTVHSVKIVGDRGIVDRTRTACFTTACEGSDKVVGRVKKEYFYINGKWYQPYDNNIFCERSEEYSYPEEFKRGVSLLLQRREQSSLKESSDIAKNYQRIRNCLNIQYAESESQMDGAEGVFSFIEGGDKEKLDIFVSPKYRQKDDLLTAILLSHEIHHAYLFATEQSQFLDCYENEAEAFGMELGLFEFDLNAEERSSIINRYGTSQEIRDFLDLRKEMLKSQKEYISDAILPIIKQSPSYQKQCNNR